MTFLPSARSVYIGAPGKDLEDPGTDLSTNPPSDDSSFKPLYVDRDAEMKQKADNTNKRYRRIAYFGMVVIVVLIFVLVLVL